MTAVELWPSIKQLPHADKLQLMQYLTADLASGEATNDGMDMIVMHSQDQCPYNSEQLQEMRSESGGRTLSEIRKSLGWK